MIQASLSVAAFAIAGAATAVVAAELDSGANGVEWPDVQRIRAEQALRPFLQGGREPPLRYLKGNARERFINSAITVARYEKYPDIKLVLYDPVTRCGYLGHFRADTGTVEDIGLVSSPHAYKIASVPALAGASVSDINFLTSQPGPANRSAGDCKTRLTQYFSSEIAKDAREYSSIARHAVGVLRGVAIAHKGATANERAARYTDQARKKINAVVMQPQFMGALKDKDRTVVIVGDPRSMIRWAAQYRNTSDGRWAFEGGSDVGISLYWTK